LLFAGNNAACVDWFGAQLLGYDPELLPIVREAFGNFRWPISSARPNEIVLSGDWGKGGIDRVMTKELPPVAHPIGWRDAAAMVLAK
jgi:hypothetical protein